ncbi:MAG: phosphate acyltransferase PlsX [Dehalococcoidia bacterium]|nr:phosphate acyltransferase PlsX [Dehalococcoidia bacterium]MDW8120202.1 phosphate acyltransferase PlsX [Chloroflexota bacterium]
MTRSLVPIALDAMGGDYGPPETVAGAVEAVRQGGVAVLLVGEASVLEAELARRNVGGLPLQVVPAQGVIQEGEPPAQALRQKPRASVAVCAGLVKQGIAQGFVSMGSTGAAMAAATLALGLLEGVERPALGGPILGFAPRTLILDLGSHVDCRPQMLVTFGGLGVAFARRFMGVENPRIALLSVGAEEGKGNRQVKEAYDLFKASGLPFIGNIEGHDLPLGKAEVVVCDGFVGNIVMKLAEGLGEAIAGWLRQRLPQQEALAQEVYALLNVVEHHGGGPLFGVRGVAVVGHGRSRAPAIARAIHTAKRAVEVGLVEGMEQELARLASAVRPR